MKSINTRTKLDCVILSSHTRYSQLKCQNKKKERIGDKTTFHVSKIERSLVMCISE